MIVDINEWNERIIAEFRANSGHVAWSTDTELAAGRPVPPALPAYGEHGMPIMLVHNTGARTGRVRISPLLYQPVGDGFALFATYGGSPRHPAWYHNLMANPRTMIELGRETIPVLARLTQRAERDRIWTTQVALTPALTDFEAAAGRRIPVMVLEPRKMGTL